MTHYKHARTGRNAVRTPQYTVPDDLHDAVLTVHPFTTFHDSCRSIPIVIEEEHSEYVHRRSGTNEGACNPNNVSVAYIKPQYGSNHFTPKPQNGTIDTIFLGMLEEYANQNDLITFM